MISFWPSVSTSAKAQFQRATKTVYFYWSKLAPKTALFKTLKHDVSPTGIGYERNNEICTENDHEW